MRETAHVGSTVALQADEIMPSPAPAHPDLRAAAARLGRGDATGSTTRPGMTSAKQAVVPSQTTAMRGSGWLGSASDFATGVGEGTWHGGAGMLQGVADLAKAGYQCATDAQARAKRGYGS